MGKMSMAEAARVFAVSRPTLLNHLKRGKISGEKTTVDKNTFWQIDESELARVYPLRADVAAQAAANVAFPGTGASEALQSEIKLLQARLEAAERLLDERGRHIDDLRAMLPGPQDRGQRRRWWPFSRG